MKNITDEKGNLWCVPCMWPRTREPKLRRGQKAQPHFNGVSLDPILLRKAPTVRRIIVFVRSCPRVTSLQELDSRRGAGLIVHEFSAKAIDQKDCNCAKLTPLNGIRRMVVSVRSSPLSKIGPLGQHASGLIVDYASWQRIHRMECGMPDRPHRPFTVKLSLTKIIVPISGTVPVPIGPVNGMGSLYVVPIP
jgi:hypothetical protein